MEQAEIRLTLAANPEYHLSGSDTPNYVPAIPSTHSVALAYQCAHGTYRGSRSCDPERSGQRQCEWKSGPGTWKSIPWRPPADHGGLERYRHGRFDECQHS